MFFLLALSLLFHTNKSSAFHFTDTLPHAAPSRSLPEVLIKKSRPLARSQGDTVSFGVSDHHRPGMFTLEDLLRGMPGFRVDPQGKIFFQGKAISRILIDGEDLTEERYALLSRNLRADLLSRVKVIQRHQPQRLLREVSSSDEIALDLAVRDDVRGRWTGSVKTEHGARGLHQQDAEGVRLTSTTKQLVFANRNNLGKTGVTGKGDLSTSAQDARYRSGPLLGISASATTVPSSYAVQNKDHSAAGIFSYPINGHTRLKINIEEGSLKQGRSFEMQRRFYVGADSLISIRNNTRSELFPTDQAISLRLQRDKGGPTVWDHQFRISKNTVRSSFQDKRSVPEDMAMLVLGKYKAAEMQWKQSITHRLRSNKVLLIENEFSTHHQNNLAWYATPATNPRIMDSVVHAGPLLHQGILIGSQLSIYASRQRWNFHYGSRSSVERIWSTATSEQLQADIYKSYGYGQASRSISKKWTQELQLAAGMVYWHKRQGNGIAAPIFQIDHRYIYRPRAVERYGIGMSVNKKPMDFSMYFAGPFLDQRGMLVDGIDSIHFPERASLSFDLLRMDLYKGFTLSFNGKYALANQQPAISTGVNRVIDRTGYVEAGSQRMIFLAGQLEKLIHPLSLTYKLNTSSQLQKTFQGFNGILLPVHMNHLQYEQSWVSRWRTILNITCFQGISYQQVRASPKKGKDLPALSKKQTGFKLLFTPTSSLFGELSFSRIRYDDLRPLLMCDAQAMWHITSRCRLSFSLQNFFDEMMITESFIAFYGSSIQTTLINSRRVLFALQYHF